MNEPTDHPNHDYQEIDYGHDHYVEGEEVPTEYADENYDSQLPVQGPRKNYSNLLIFGCIGIFVLVMGYFTFGPMLFPKAPDAANGVSNASALLKTPQLQATQNAAQDNPAPPVVAMAPMPAPAPAGTAPTPNPAAQPGNAVMGVSPAAPITNAVNNPIIPPANPNDPWAQPTGNNATAAVAPVTQPIGATPAPQPASASSLAADAAFNQKLTALQQKLDQSEAARQDQNTTITELQNRLSESESKLANLAAQPTAAPANPSAPASAAKVKKQAKAKSDSNVSDNASAKTPQTWELRSAADGVAWVSRPADNQLYRVSVGDELPGVGRVTAIRQQGDSWIVVGTTGQIHQN